jgi:hypothetical protein
MTDNLIALLTLIASGGSGWIASWAFDQARAAISRPTRRHWVVARWHKQLVWRLLYHPRVAQIVNVALAAVLGFAASVAAAWLSGEDVQAAIEAAINVFFLAPALSYVRHRHTALAPATQMEDDNAAT